MLQLPLTPAQFRHAIYAGLGRAVMHVRAHGGAGLEEIIYDACIKHRAYDPQVDSPRDAWLLHILDLSGHEPALRPRLIEALGAAEDIWDANQLCGLVATIAGRGDAAARDALYTAFENSRRREWWLGGRQIIELDGIDGLLRVARVVGARLRRDPTMWVDAEMLEVTAAVSSRDAVVEALVSAAPSDPDVEAFRSVLMDEESPRRATGVPSLDKWQDLTNPTADDRDRFKADRERRRAALRNIPFKEIRRRFDDPATQRFPGRGWFVEWGTAAHDDDLREVAQSLATETDDRKLACLLAIFSRRPLPLAPPRLIELVSRPEHEIGWAAAKALSHVADDAVRATVLDRLKSEPLRKRHILMLTAGYRPGDAAIIEPLLRDTGDEHDTHGIIHAMVNLYERNKLPESLGPLLWVYETSTCSNCRRSAVTTLVELGIAPDWLIEECRFDVDAGVREAVGGRRDEFGDDPE